MGKALHGAGEGLSEDEGGAEVGRQAVDEEITLHMGPLTNFEAWRGMLHP